MIILISIFLSGSIGSIFIPTTKEAVIIYGVGNTIDYLKSNKTAGKLPDKALKVLDLYLDKELKEESDSIEQGFILEATNQKP